MEAGQEFTTNTTSSVLTTAQQSQTHGAKSSFRAFNRMSPAVLLALEEIA